MRRVYSIALLLLVARSVGDNEGSKVEISGNQ